jgi:hypothetical protein
VGVEEKFHQSNTSQSCSLEAGEITSPTILPSCLKLPSHEAGFLGLGGGETIAMGSPLRVIRRDCLVFLTLLSSDKHVALNFETAIVSCVIISPSIQNNDYFDHSQ